MGTSLGEVVREAREKAGLSLAELARRADVDRGHLHRFEGGTRDMSGTSLQRVFDALGLEVTTAPSSAA